MCDPVSASVGLIAAGVSAWGAKEQSDATKQATRAQERAWQKQQEDLKKQGVAAIKIDESSQFNTANDRLKRLRGGMWANIKAGNLMTRANTAETGLKATLGA